MTADAAPAGWLASYRGFSRATYAVFAARGVNVFGSGLVYPFAALHFHQTVGIPLGLVGLGLLANNVATAVGNGAGGVLSDRVGRRPVMVASMASSAVTLAGYALVDTAAGFVGVATLAGLTLGLYAPASQAAVADLVPSGDRDRAFAVLKVASNAGFGMGFVVGGALYGAAGAAIFVADGLTSAVVAVLLFAALPRRLGADDAGPVDGSASDDADGGPGFRDTVAALRRPAVASLLLLNVGFAVAYGQMGSTVPVYAEETLGLTSAAIGLVFVVNPATVVALQLPVTDRLAGWRRTRTLGLSALVWGASFLVLLAGYRVAGLGATLVGAAVLGGYLFVRTVGEVLHAPTVIALASDAATPGTKGGHLSALVVAKRVGFGVGAAVGGAAFDAGLERPLWLGLAVLCLALLAGLAALERLVEAEANRPGEDGAAAAPDDAA